MALFDTQDTLIEQLRAQSEAQNILNENQRTVSAQLRAQSDYQEMEIQRLGRSQDQHQIISSRFLSVCKCNVFDTTDKTDHEVTNSGIVAHNGDPQSDAMLYQLGIRNDEGTFISLYGLGWREVMKLSKFFTSYEIQIVYTFETNLLPSSPQNSLCTGYPRDGQVFRQRQRSQKGSLLRFVQLLYHSFS